MTGFQSNASFDALASQVTTRTGATVGAPQLIPSSGITDFASANFSSIYNYLDTLLIHDFSGTLDANNNLISDAPHSVNNSVFETFFSQFNAIQHMPTTLEGLVNVMGTYFQPYLAVNKTLTDAKADFTTAFLDIAQTQMSLFGSTDATVAAALTGLPNTFSNDVLTRTMNDFLSSFQYDDAHPNIAITDVANLTAGLDLNSQIGTPGGGGISNTGYTGFFFGPRGVASLDQAGYFPDLVNGGNLGGQFEDVLDGSLAINFRDIFNAYDSGTAAQKNTDFITFLSNYVQKAMYSTNTSSATSTSTFTPSMNVGDFMEKVQEQYMSAKTGTNFPLSSVGQSFVGIDIINKIFALLVAMIGTLQSVAAAQSDQLRTLTNWQAAYTNLQSKIHTFVSNDGTPVASATTQQADLTNVNQAFTTNITNRRSVLQDSAKAVQANINQTTDNSNQQANIATSIIQELSTILGAIYK